MVQQRHILTFRFGSAFDRDLPPLRLHLIERSLRKLDPSFCNFFPSVDRLMPVQADALSNLHAPSPPCFTESMRSARRPRVRSRSRRSRSSFLHPSIQTRLPTFTLFLLFHPHSKHSPCLCSPLHRKAPRNPPQTAPPPPASASFPSSNVVPVSRPRPRPKLTLHPPRPPQHHCPPQLPPPNRHLHRRIHPRRPSQPVHVRWSGWTRMRGTIR
jgi:hypothetical protein